MKQLFNHSNHQKVLWTLCLLATFSFSGLFGQSSWKEIGPLSSPIIAMEYDGSNYLYAASASGIYRSADNGDNWTLFEAHAYPEIRTASQYGPTNTGFANMGGTMYTLYFSKDYVYTEPVSLYSVQSGWLMYIENEDTGRDLENWEVQDFAHIGNRILISTGSKGRLWYLDLPNDDWQFINSTAIKLFVDNGKVLACGPGGVITESLDGGLTWQAYGGGNLPGVASEFTSKGNKLFASVPGHGIFVSKSGGSWTNRTNNLPWLSFEAMVNHQGVIYVAGGGGIIWKTNNNGQSWQNASGHWGWGNPPSIERFFSVNGSLFAGSWSGIFRKAPGSDAWSHSMEGLASSTIDYIAAKNDHLVAGKTVGEFKEGSPGYETYRYISSNPWKSWKAESIGGGFGLNGFQHQDDLVFFFEDGELGYWQYLPYLYTSYLTGTGPRYGFSWYNDSTDEECYTHETILSVAVIGNHFFASFGTHIAVSDQPYMQVNNQCSLSYSNLPHYVNYLRVDGSILIACTDDGVYTSADLANTWSPAGLQGRDVDDIVEGNDFWLALTDDGLYRAWDTNPTGWQRVSTNNPGKYIIWANKVLYSIHRTYSWPIGTSELRYSIDKGVTWQVLATDPGMSLLNPFALAAEGNDFLFVGTEGRGIWRYPLLNPPAARLAAPEGLSMKAYPNPTPGFINIEAEGKGTLDIFTPDGRWLGKHAYEGPTQTLNLLDLPSGIYFIRLMNEEGVQTVQVSKQ